VRLDSICDGEVAQSFRCSSNLAEPVWF
jgi:hypothetical protein